MNPSPWRIVATVLGILFLAMVAASFYQTGAAKRANAHAAELTTLRFDAAKLFKVRSVELKETREESDRQLAEAHEHRQAAERRLTELEAHTARVTAEAVQTGGSILEAVRALHGTDPPPSSADLEELVLVHLEEDARVVVAYESQLEEMRVVQETIELASGAWKMRAVAAENALEAKTLECKLAVSEANAWREAANPGWFTRFRQNIPSMGLTALATIVVIIAL